MLDQFFTTSKTAQEFVRFFGESTQNLLDPKKIQFIEPSAGAGDFLAHLPSQTIALDIDPQCKEIHKQDFFTYPGPKGINRKDIAIIGNPPFGRRGKLALEFCKHASKFADTIAFIVPMCFTKYGIHKHFPLGYKLIAEKKCKQNAFYIPTGKPYNVGAVFQIWTALNCNSNDLRIYSAPPISHPDFQLYQYNNTKQAEKVFYFPFDFAVPCQGYQNYTRREKHQKNCERNKQWMLFNCKDKDTTYKILSGIDYEKLAYQQVTTTPGFRKHDVIKEYKNVSC